jgi:hypothetical protein
MSNLSKSKVVPLPLCRRKRGKHANVLLILTSALEGGEWSASRPGRALPPGKDIPRPPYPLDRRLGGTQSWSGPRG